MLTAQNREKRGRQTVLCFAAAAFLLQLAMAAITEKYPYDAGCFAAWALRMAEGGPAAFYADGYFCDYPPGYMLLLWLPGKLIGRADCSEKLRQAVLAFWPALAGFLMPLAVYRIGLRGRTPEQAVRMAAFTAFCPAILYDTGVWGQIDSVPALLLLCCFALLEEKKYVPAAAFYGLALAVKPQALLVGPVLALCCLGPVLSAADKKRALRDAVLSALTAAAVPLAAGLPFWGIGGLWDGLWAKYGTTTASYPYATINACNFMAFLGGEWKDQTTAALRLGGVTLLTWQQLGLAGIAAVTVFTAIWAWKAARAGRFSPLLTAAVYGIGIFTLAHRMHERYLIFAVILLLGAAARFGSKKLLSLAAGFSLTSLLNMALVFGVVGTEHEYLDDAVSRYMQRGTGLAETALFILLISAAWELTVPEAGDGTANRPENAKRPRKERMRQKGMAAPRMSRENAKQPFRKDTAQATAQNAECHQAKTLRQINTAAAEAASAVPAAQPAWSRRERLFVLSLTAAVAVLSFCYLGDLTAPQTCLDANRDTVRFTVLVDSGAAEVQVYTGISSDNAGHLTITDEQGNSVAEQDLQWGSSFNWYTFALDGGRQYAFTLTDGQIFEIAFRDADGKLLGMTCDAAAVADEQKKVPDSVSQLNTFYFDEIYHARTGYELLHGMTVYETTHPPLGKDLIALGIAVFGMTGFGWRFAGTLFGVLLVPLLYGFVRRLTRKPGLAAFAAGLLALDFMRFSQSRLATIDTYAVFFILLAVDFMTAYCKSVLTRGVSGSILPMALSGMAFGLACASKWTGIYAGAGLAILYFSVLAARHGQLCGGETAQDGTGTFRREFWTAIGGGVLFFVLVPLGIYLLSYAPYRLHDPAFGLRDWWNCQVYMFRYHSTLNATHPFSSNWYSWLLDLRPVWYYMGSGLPQGMYASIAGFVSPVVALVGLAAWLRTAQRQLVGEGSRAGGVVIVALLSSLLPWVLVTRCTFLYHYFPCVPFLITAAALELGRLQQRSPRQARRAAVVILGAAAVLFAWFYPVLSGLPVPAVWAASMKWLESWGFYIL